jgi:tetratricopeptide (TPR) repeat protein
VIRHFVVAATLVALAGRADAQSTRYPPPAVDVDAEREDHSELWENALEPGLDRYDELVARAVTLLDSRGSRGYEDRATALELLDEASQLLPGRADAWAWLGLAREKDADWSGCRDALDRAWAIDPRWSAAHRPLGVAVGVCRGRAGDLEGALEVLERLVARGDDSVETLWRLGEVDMALGRLDDARDVLAIALDQSPADTHYVNAAWTMAVAADRARDPDAAREAAAVALRLDSERFRVQWPAAGFLPASDFSYYAMIAAAAAGADEEALFHARRFTAGVPDSPWLDRVAEHVRALSTFTAGDRLSVLGTDPGDPDDIRKKLAKVDPDLQACLKATPRALLQVQIVVTAAPAKNDSRTIPKAGVTVTALLSDELDLGATIACVSKVAATVKLGIPSVPGTWTTAMVPVIYR